MEALQTQVAALIVRVNTLSTQLTDAQAQIQTQAQAQAQPTIEEYKDVTVTVSVPNDVALDIFKTLPEFNGDREKYATWRTMTRTALGLLKNHQSSKRFFEALMIVRNKITGTASNILNNYNTAFNLDAIIDRLDFTYADKRPLYILEQELLVLQQNKLSLDEFYDLVNEKLNRIVNKINMTYKEKATAIAFVNGANERALRTFITGLNNKRGELLYASNPATLPEAYARLQTIINDQERIVFANRFNSKGETKEWQNLRNPQFRTVQQQNRRENSTGNPQGNENWRARRDEKYEYSFGKQNNQQQAEAMEIDRTSTAVNVERKNSVPFKREFSKNNSRAFTDHQQKVQRINNVSDEMSNAEHHDICYDDEFDGPSNEIPDETESIF